MAAEPVENNIDTKTPQVFSFYFGTDALFSVVFLDKHLSQYSSHNGVQPDSLNWRNDF
jgi:hypothetical protein